MYHIRIAGREGFRVEEFASLGKAEMALREYLLLGLDAFLLESE